MPVVFLSISPLFPSVLVFPVAEIQDISHSSIFLKQLCIIDMISQ